MTTSATSRPSRRSGRFGRRACRACWSARPRYEEDALVAISDVILDGTAGVAEWLAALADAIDAAG